jgi:hypothetical protein
MDEVIDMLNLLNNEGITDQQDLQSMLDDAKKVYTMKEELVALQAKYTDLHSVACEVHCFVEGQTERMKLYKDDFANLHKVLLTLRRVERGY